jgi:hypothetical protein
VIVNIHIERLILDGLSIPYHHQEKFQAAVETELRNQFTNNLPESLMQCRALSEISAGDIQITDASDPVCLGQEIGRAVYEGVNR